MKVRGQTVYLPEQRIRRLSEVDPETGCWNWKSTTRNGYGRLIIGSRADKTRRSVSAHRFSFEAFVGPISDGNEVCHQCDNPRCVNPEHLFQGSRQDNIDDREAKGRGVYLRGERNGMSKLTAQSVLIARAMREAGASYAKIACEFAVDKSTIEDAIKGFHWKHVVSSPAPPAAQGGPTEGDAA